MTRSIHSKKKRDLTKPVWLFDNKEFDDKNLDLFYGFCYRITNLVNGMMYIGRKTFWKSTRPRKESNWRSYWGSSEELRADLEQFGYDSFKREILSLHKTAGDLNIYETTLLFRAGVLESPLYYNMNIAGRYFRMPSHIIESRVYANSAIREHRYV